MNEPRQRTRSRRVVTDTVVVDVERREGGVTTLEEPRITHDQVDVSAPITSRSMGIGDVSVEGSSTHNLGDYNSAKVSVIVRLPVLTPLVTAEEDLTDEDLEVLNKAYMYCSNKVTEYMNRELDAILGPETN